MLASCSATGNCILIDVIKVSLPKIFNCFHLYGNLLDKVKFSHHGELLGISNSQTGIMFIIGKRCKQQRVNVLGFIEIDGYVRLYKIILKYYLKHYLLYDKLHKNRDTVYVFFEENLKIIRYFLFDICFFL